MPNATPTRHVGWLLRANRLLGHATALRSGREFARAFRLDSDRPLAPSQITRWESGQLAAGHGTLRRYEHLLGLNPESLITLNDALVRIEGSTTARYLESGQPHDRRQLFELLERAQTPGAMTGRHWSRLTELVATEPGLVLYPPQLWRTISDQLLHELSVAVYSAWFQRQEAMSRLLEHPEAGQYAVQACIDLAQDPSSPVVLEPMNLLDVTADSAANAFILEQIAKPADERALHGALLAAARKISQRHFRDQQWSRLIHGVRRHLLDPNLDQTLRPLVAALGRQLTRQLPGAAMPLVNALKRATPSTDAAVSTTAGVLAEQLAQAARLSLASDDIEHDGTLTTLIAGALFDEDPNRRLITAMLIAATPYREPVARAILHGVTRDIARGGHTYPLGTFRTLTNLEVDLHRGLIETLLTTPSFPTPLRHAAAWAMPHCPGKTEPGVWRSILDTQFALWARDPSGINESVLHAIAYGIGTDGHRYLLTEIRDDPQLSAAARTTAVWLLDTEEIAV